MRVLRQAFAGLVWSKQMYPYDVRRWLDGDPNEPPPPEAHRHGRNSGWRHLDSFDVLAMPDPWEYPWFAAWDLGFHAVAWAHIDPAFAKYQVLVLLREWFQHPNGALPSYEWNFDDVNPPVHVMAAVRVFAIDGGKDREFLERVFQKLLVNFTWWLNRQDADGNNVFSGGFLGLDNISPIDRSNLPPGVTLEQADGTAWMAYYALSMLYIALVLAEENDVYLDMVVKFLEQFVLIARALESQDLYDAEDGFFYDRLAFPSGERTPVKVQTIAGLLPILPAVGLPAAVADRADALGKRFARLRARWAETGGGSVGWVREVDDEELLISVVAPERLRLVLREFFDESAFLSPHGLRSVSKRYEAKPYTIDAVPGATIDYEPAESTTPMFGGNSNWRGPVWMPLNYLAIRSFVQFQRVLGDSFTVEYPTGSGVERSFGWVAQDLADRIVSTWLPRADGSRPINGGTQRLQEDPVWKDNLLFYEYLHGDNGAGLGAMHQTGWTALVVDLLLDPPGR
jgi:Mannosylglycerate hydrolase MGH1-like glycoside hydrolase domain